MKTPRRGILDREIEAAIRDSGWRGNRSTCRLPHRHVVGFDPWRAYLIRRNLTITRKELGRRMAEARLIRNGDDPLRFLPELITLWERGEQAPTVKQFLAMAHALKAPLGAFLDCRSGCHREWKWLQGRGRARR